MKLKDKRLEDMRDDIAVERKRKMRLYHNFTDKELTEKEEKLLQRSAGDVICGTERSIPFPDITRYLKESVLDMLLNYCKATCSERTKLTSGRTRAELLRYLAHPNMPLELISYVNNVLEQINGYEYPNSNNTSYEKKLSEGREFKQLIQDVTLRRDVIIRESDKRLGWSINTSNWYMQEYDRQLRNTNYEKVEMYEGETNPEAITEKIIKSFDKDMKCLINKKEISEHFKEKITLTGFSKCLNKIPFMNLMPKVHKLSEHASKHVEHKLTGRPIITAFAWCTVELSKQLSSELREILINFRKHMAALGLKIPTICSSNEYMKRVDNLVFDSLEGYHFISFDFKDLYTNILFENIERSIRAVCSILHIHKTKCQLIIEMYRLYINYSYFRVGNVIYRQKEGISMGSYCAVEVSKLVLLHAEYEFLLTMELKEKKNLSLMLLGRYIDDGSMIVQTEELVDLFNVLKQLFMFYPRNMEISVTINRYKYVFLALDYETMESKRLHKTVYFK